MDYTNRTGQSCVLLIYNEADCGELLNAVLQREGFSVLSCCGAEHGVELLRTTTVDAVVSDMQLPGMDGIGLLKHIRMHHGEMPVILMAGRGSISSAVDAMQSGANDYLTGSPDNGKKLVVSLCNAIKQHRLTVRNAMLLEQLKQRGETLQQLLHNAHDSIYLFKLNGDGEIQRFVEVNGAACAQTGYSEEELLDKTILDIIFPEHRADVQKSISVLPDSGSTVNEAFQVTKSGRMVPVELKSRRFLLGGRIMIVMCVRDITQQRETDANLTNAVENERRQLGQELHDLLCQDLASISMLASLIQDQPNAVMIGGLARKSVSFVRELCEGIFPVGIEIEGLNWSLRRLAENQERFTDISCSFQEIGNINVENKITALNVYRIAQESVKNAVRHSRARHISMILKEDGGGGALIVEDDGAGVSRATPCGAGMGLNIMRHRASMIGAVLEIETIRGKGTRVICSWRQNM